MLSFFKNFFKECTSNIQLCLVGRSQIFFWHVCMCVNVSAICKCQILCLEKIKGSRSLAELDTLAHGKRKYFPWDMCMYSFVQQVCFVLKTPQSVSSSARLGQHFPGVRWWREKPKSWIYSKLRWLPSVLQMNWDWGICKRLCPGESIYKLSFSSKIPF